MSLYTQSPVPETEDINELRRWIAEEFAAIEESLRTGQFKSLRLEKVAFPPDKYAEGMLYNMAADVLGPGKSSGLYFYHEAVWYRFQMQVA